MHAESFGWFELEYHQTLVKLDATSLLDAFSENKNLMSIATPLYSRCNGQKLTVQKYSLILKKSYVTSHSKDFLHATSVLVGKKSDSSWMHTV